MGPFNLNVTFLPTPVCVWPPFVFIVSNSSVQNLESLECNEKICFYAQCWDVEQFPIAIVARMPRWIPVPVDAGLATGLSSWIAAAMNHLKEWAGMGAMAGLLLLVFFVGLWCLCKMRFAQRRHAVMVVQAFTAIEAGQYPPSMSCGNAQRIIGLSSAPVPLVLLLAPRTLRAVVIAQ